MKQLFISLLAVGLLSASCVGPEGPPGDPGINILGKVIEVSIDLNQSNNYEQLVTLPLSIEVFESDVVLVYRHEGVLTERTSGHRFLPPTLIKVVEPFYTRSIIPTLMSSFS